MGVWYRLAGLAIKILLSATQIQKGTTWLHSLLLFFKLGSHISITCVSFSSIHLVFGRFTFFLINSNLTETLQRGNMATQEETDVTRGQSFAVSHNEKRNVPQKCWISNTNTNTLGKWNKIAPSDEPGTCCG